MSKCGLIWDELKKILTFKLRASQAMKVFEKDTEGATLFKKQMSVVSNNSNSNSSSSRYS